MAFVLFEKTEIASYTDISALLCVMKSNSSEDILWKYQLYGNLCWEKHSHILYNCGKYDHFSYKEFEDEKRIVLEKLPQNSNWDVVKDYIDNGFYILLPINTLTLGYTDVPFKHNVFITGYEEELIAVYDYWTPKFMWKYELIERKNLFNSIDFSNPDTVQRIYAFKKNADYKSSGSNVDIFQLSDTYLKLWSLNCFYNKDKSIYGDNIYVVMAEYIRNLDEFKLTDCQNMHIVLEHLRFTKNTFEQLYNDNSVICECVSELNDLVLEVERLRNAVYKYYLSHRKFTNENEFFYNKIINIGNHERDIKSRIRRLFGNKE